MTVTLGDVPAQCRTKKYITSTYGVSGVTAWRLLSGKVTHICPGYHNAFVTIASGAWDAITSPYITRHIRNCIVHQLKIWQRNCLWVYLDDIAQECYIRAYQKSGIWMDMPEPKKMAYLATLAKRTTNDLLKKHVHYTDKYKCNMYTAATL